MRKFTHQKRVNNHGTLYKDFSRNRSHPGPRILRALLVADGEGVPGHHEQKRRGLHPHGLATEVRR